MRRKERDTSSYSKNSSSRTPNSSTPYLSFFAVEISIPYFVFYSSITTSAAVPPIESISATVLLYFGKGYIITEEYPNSLLPDIIPAYPNNLIPDILPAYPDRKSVV